MTVLHSLELPYKMLGKVPTGQILLDSGFKVLSPFSSTLKQSFSLLSNLI